MEKKKASEGEGKSATGTFRRVGVPRDTEWEGRISQIQDVPHVHSGGGKTM
jgi:hypothetical protein